MRFVKLSERLGANIGNSIARSRVERWRWRRRIIARDRYSVTGASLQWKFSGARRMPKEREDCREVAA